MPVKVTRPHSPTHTHTRSQELRVVGNQLRILPPDVGRLTNLRVLAADSNQLTILPGAACGRAACLGTAVAWGPRGRWLPKRLRHVLPPAVDEYRTTHACPPTMPAHACAAWCALRAHAGELRRCEVLEELTLQHNRLTSVLLSFASLRHLRCGGAARELSRGHACMGGPCEGCAATRLSSLP